MQIIMFTGDSPDKILDGSKTMTARHWLRKLPPLGSLFRAQRGRGKDSSFAVCKVLRVAEWDGVCQPPYIDLGYEWTRHLSYWEDKQVFRADIARKEGFDSWWSFIDAYVTLNALNWDDERRKHYFIEFEVKELL